MTEQKPNERVLCVLSFDDYQQATDETAIYPKKNRHEYVALGLVGEAGELAGKVKKEIRDGVDHTDAILDELGDVLWYVARVAAERGVALSSIAEHNLEKLRSRKARGVLGGSGDNR